MVYREVTSIDNNARKLFPYSKLDPHFISANDIRTTDEYSVEAVRARDLIVPERFDLIAKILYVKAYIEQQGLPWAIELYKDSINAMTGGSFKEGGSETKNTFNAYVEEFNMLIQCIGLDGFDRETSLVPLGANGEIFDGAHRVAATAFFDQTIDVIRFSDRSPALSYDYKYLRGNLMSDINMSIMARYYAEIKDDCFIICLLPTKQDEDTRDIIDLIHNSCKIVYEQSLYLTKHGFAGFMSRYAAADDVNAMMYDRRSSMRVFLCESVQGVGNRPIDETISDIMFDGADSLLFITDSPSVDAILELLSDRSQADRLNYPGTPGFIKPLYSRLVVPRQYRSSVLEKMHNDQLRRGMYSLGTSDYTEYRKILRDERHAKLKRWLTVMKSGTYLRLNLL